MFFLSSSYHHCHVLCLSSYHHREPCPKAEVKALSVAEDSIEKDKEEKTHKRKAALFGIVAIFISFAQVSPCCCLYP